MQNYLCPIKIGFGWAIFVRGKVAKAEHTMAYVSILLSDDSCKIYPSEFHDQKIVNGGGNFGRS